MIEHSALLVGHYNYFLVALSVSIAMLSAYATLDLAERVTDAQGNARLLWLSCGAIAMGTGIWSMHYIGMLAFKLPVTVMYDWPMVLLSLAAAILASGCALFCVSRKKMGTLVTITGGIFMGTGIAAMHYIGMEAMRLPAMCSYSPSLVTVSVVLAIVIAFVALWRVFALRGVAAWNRSRVINAFILGAAIPVMHYVGMAAAHFTPGALPASALDHAINISDLGVACVTLVTVVMLGLVFITATVDRRFNRQALALEGSEQRYRRIVESTFDAFLVLDHSGQITDWSAQAESMFGWSRTEAIGKSAREIFVWEERGESAQHGLRDLLTKDTERLTERIELTGRHRNGHEFPAEAAVSSLQLGQSSLLTVFVHDVTKRKKEQQEKEEALAAVAAAAEEGGRAKSEFLANMSHEIRTPLNGVIGMTDLALETELTREQRDYLETVKLSADSLLSVINSILDFSKIEAGKVDLEAVDFELRDCMEAALKTLALRADEKGLELLCDVASEVPDTVMGDPGRLRQILVNLVGNAIKFTDQGEVALKVEVERTVGHQVTLHFVVSDTGIGIAPEKAESIFESFAQADTSTTREYGGTGLGLTISKRLVELMGGRIWIESELGAGSHFHFTIQIVRSEAKLSTGDGITRPEMLAGVKVLVIDDNRTNRRILEGLLKSWGMEPTVVPGAAEALVALDESQKTGQSFQLIVTDMHMPKMDGFGLVEKIQQTGGSATATIMMLTSGGHRGDAARCQQLGIAAYLLKPVRKMELREAIAKVLGAKDQSPITPPTMITRDSLQEERDPVKRLDILVAEDNVVNQKLATRLLEKRGHKVVVVGNGREALAALTHKSYDLVLMDVQMPELDGISATTMLREKEKLTGTHQVVIAMTALAMKSDRERCLAAGMDGYLSKPIRRQELDEVLDSRIAQQSSSSRMEAPVSSRGQPAVNVDELLERLDGDRAFLAELTDVFRADYPGQISAIHEAILRDDALGVKQASHALKGALSNLAASQAREMAANLESLGASGDLSSAKIALEDLEKELTRTIESLDELCQETVQ
jgi:two-component system, sensor histidine kinase and response regulator